MITNELLHKLLDESPTPVQISAIEQSGGISGFELTYSSWTAFSKACRALGNEGWSGAPVIFEAESLVLIYYKSECRDVAGQKVEIEHKLIMNYKEPT